MRPLSQRPQWSRRPNPRNARMVEMYAAGISIGEIARRTGAGVSLVHHTLQRAGVQMRSRAEGRALGMRRAARRRLIAEAAQKRFGHLLAPIHVGTPARPAPVNSVFADEAFASGVAFDVSDAWVAGV